ncbi:hypothetical protein [Rubidibacter lacunae]|uniref:hypothetical protein n=1 Tax=Rubidibacter lacunae TaxID=582514 RepID=UPI0012EBECF3|nr:hypothetical protein [Rubidibacter lacunae]
MGKTLETIPTNQSPYIGSRLTSDKFQFDGSPQTVGFAWAGSTMHKTDRNRSATIQDVLQLLQLLQFRLYSLVGTCADDLKELLADVEIVALGGMLDD